MYEIVPGETDRLEVGKRPLVKDSVTGKLIAPVSFAHI